MSTPTEKDSSSDSDEKAVKSATVNIPAPVPYATARPELFPFCGSYKTGDIDPSIYTYNPGTSRSLKRSHSQTVPPLPVGAQQDISDDDEDGFFPETDVFATQTPPPPTTASVGRGPGFIEGDFEEAPFLRSKEEIDML